MKREILPEDSPNFHRHKLLVFISVLLVTAPCLSQPLSRIAFSQTVDASHNRDIFTMLPDGSDVVQLTDNPGDDRCPSWSPDAKSIAFVSTRDGATRLYVMSADDGSNLQTLPEPPLFSGSMPGLPMPLHLGRRMELESRSKPQYRTHFYYLIF